MFLRRDKNSRSSDPASSIFCIRVSILVLTAARVLSVNIPIATSSGYTTSLNFRVLNASLSVFLSIEDIIGLCKILCNRGAGNEGNRKLFHYFAFFNFFLSVTLIRLFFVFRFARRRFSGRGFFPFFFFISLCFLLSSLGRLGTYGATGTSGIHCLTDLA